MKKLIIFIVIVFSVQLLTAQNIKIENPANIDKFPNIEFTVNLKNSAQLDKEAISVSENGNSLYFDLKVKKHDSSNKKNILFIFEDMTSAIHCSTRDAFKYCKQKEFYKQLLTGSLNGFANKGDNINIAVFDRSRNGKTPLRFIQKDYTDDTETLLKSLNEKNFSKYDHFSYNKSSDLYNAINDGIEDLNSKFTKQNSILVVLSAGYNNPSSNQQTTETLKDLAIKNNIPIYMIQYPIWEHRSMKTFIQSTNGRFLYANKKNIKQAQDSLINFMNNAVEKINGYDYTINTSTDNKPDGTMQTFLVKMGNQSKEVSYVAKCSNFNCWYKYNKGLFFGLIFGLIIVVGLIIFFVTKNKQKMQNISTQQDILAQEVKSKPVVDQEMQGNLAKTQQEIERLKQQQLKEKSQYEAEKRQRLAEEKRLAEAKRKAEQDKFILEQMKRSGPLPKLSYEIDGQYFQCVIDKAEKSFGRKNSDCIVDSNYVSRAQFTIYFKDGNYYLKNLSKTNGTIVNGNKVNQSILLNDRDLIIVGPIGFTFTKF